VTVNQKGKTERIHVNLEAIYPTPEIIGSELSLEELRAGHRGWLTKVWEPEIPNEPSSKAIPIFRDKSSEATPVFRDTPSEAIPVFRDTPSESIPVFRDTSSKAIPVFRDTSSRAIPIFRDTKGSSKDKEPNREVSTKLVIARDSATLDENGVRKESAREGRGRRMKIKEVNETQISMLHSVIDYNRLTGYSQSKVIVPIGAKDD
jgi:checkpoint serine/threonine-protein kinase